MNHLFESENLITELKHQFTVCYTQGVNQGMSPEEAVEMLKTQFRAYANTMLYVADHIQVVDMKARENEGTH